MNGAESLFATLSSAGVEVCFANPGTTELLLMTGLMATPALRPVLVTHENVATGAADGFARMTGRPASTLLHLGPGFANGMANLHNARRARSPIVTIVGDQATWHRGHDPALAMDIEGAAKTVSDWVRTSRSSLEVGRDATDAVAAAAQGINATLIVPSDLQAGPSMPAAAPPAHQPVPVSDRAIDSAAAAIRQGQTALLLGGRALSEAALTSAHRIAAALGADLLAEAASARVERGAGRPMLKPVPYWPDQAMALLGGYRAVILVGARDPVSLFGYPGCPSRLIPAAVEVHTLAWAGQDAAAALSALADALNAPPAPPFPARDRPAAPRGPLTAEALCRAVASAQPDGAIVMNEAVSSGHAYWEASGDAPPFTQMSITGAAIGQGLPTGLGAALACPDRPVIVLQADGSGLYTPQALWSMARENANVTVVICANRAYRILQIELARAGLAMDDQALAALTALTPPTVDWTAIARGFGVPADRVETAEDLAAAVAAAVREPGPALIEAIMAV